MEPQKEAVLKQAIQMWKNTQYDLECTHSVANLLEDPPERVAEIRKQVERTVKAIAFYEAKLAELESPKIK
jgi:hypothetical protein